MRNFSIISVSVTGGHPDKLCDRLSDAIVDRFMRVDRYARLEVECAISAGLLFCACHTSSEMQIDIADAARQVIAKTHYPPEELDAGSVPVMLSLSRLSEPTAGPSAATTVATHNVTTFGYATGTTEPLLPVPIFLAHELARGLEALAAGAEARFPYDLHPDAQVQVMVRYEDRRPVAVEGITFLLDVHDAAVASEALADDLRERLVLPALALLPVPMRDTPQVLVNPQGAMVGGGPSRHAGVTGRKIGVDTYGDFAHQPSTALSGKDPGRIDRVATYAARYAASNVVAAGLAEECEVQLCYRVGRSAPASVEVDTFGSGRLDDRKIGARLRECLDLRPEALEARFQLRERASASDGGFFEPLATFGHVGRRDLDLPWERTDLAL